MIAHKIIIIGSGFGGQAAAINLIKRNINNFLILERRDFMGGTWKQNTYPGAAVDVQSPLYSISHEPYPWSQMFAEQAELAQYTNHVIDKFQLRQKTRLNSNVTEVRWQQEIQRWHIQLADGECLEAQFIINASGPLSTPVIPDFPGKDTFKGESFHTNDWNHNFDHKDKKVAIIGSGASAIQVIPAITDDCKELHVFQRTPHWVMPRHDRKFSAWQQKLLGNKFLYNILRQSIYWALETRVVGFKYSSIMLKLAAQSKAKKHLKKQVKSDELRDKLTPDFTIGCKRILLSNSFYPALQKNHVQLHDKNDGIKEITESGIVTQNGQSIDLDLIVYSTGYDATDGVISYPVIGKDNKKLSDFWQEYPRAYMGTSVPEFPNLFIVTGPNTGIGHTSAIFLIEAQMHYIMSAIEAVTKNKNQLNVIEVNADSEHKYTTMIHREMEKTVWKTGGCNSWYQSNSGHVVAMFPGFSFTFKRWAKNFRVADHTIY